MNYYLSGPMSGLPQYNYPAFLAAAEALRKHGYTVFNPAEMDSEEMQKIALMCPTGTEYKEMCEKHGVRHETWGEILARDVHLIIDTIDGIIFLPNWTASKGARLEAFAALSSGPKYKPNFKWWRYFNDEHGFRLVALTAKEVKDAIFNNTPVEEKLAA